MWVAVDGQEVVFASPTPGGLLKWLAENSTVKVDTFQATRSSR